MTVAAPIDSKIFYRQLPAFTVFNELMDDRHYCPVPDDWVVVLTDIKGSTKAIAENRYKDVNLLGAASIVAILNGVSDRAIPYVFGGDGATVLIHESELERIQPALQATLRLAREAFDLEMRIGLVPVRDLSSRGLTIEVAKFGVSSKASFAMIRGGGISAAEKLIKSRAYLVPSSAVTEPFGNPFKGLSCRWNPVKSRRGEMLSLLVMALGEDPKITYRRVLAEIDGILTSDSQPITAEKIDRQLRLSNLKKEFDLQTVGQSLFQKSKRILEMGMQVLVMRILMVTGWSMGEFTAEKHIREMATQSDSKKFDDMLRMIRDCSPSERRKIEDYLIIERKAGRLVYGLHSSSEAMMTCLVFNLGDHVHFVDGGDGGYALAAKQLKEQLAAST